jgi:REP element-mobilizing transposase RayT
MPRQLRIQYPGAMYHVMSRGDRREDIFLDDVDRQDFLKTLAEACQKTDWQVHAYCLMGNHYHWVLETPNANLVAGMAWLQSAYTIRLNHRHKLIGQVLSGRYKAQLVEGGGNGYLRTACDYYFRKRLLEEMEGKLGEHHSGALRRERAEAKGERIIAQELGRLGWREVELISRRKSDPAKLGMAARLRRETTLPMKVIAGRLHLGTSRSANVRLHAAMQGAMPARPNQSPPRLVNESAPC